MKKAISLMLAFVLCLSLCACGKSEAVIQTSEAVIQTEELIAAIGEVNWQSEDAIYAAQQAYDALPEEEKAKVENYNVLEEALNTFKHPFSIKFQTEDELLETFNAFFTIEDWDALDYETRDAKINRAIEVLRNNVEIHHFFEKSDEAIALALKLYENDVLNSIFYSDYLWRIFQVCNETEWYAAIAKTNEFGWHSPLFDQAWEDYAPTKKSVANDIKKEFYDPESVSVLSGTWVFMPPVDGLYELPFEIKGYFEVRYANGLGGHTNMECVLFGEIGRRMGFSTTFASLYDDYFLWDISNNGELFLLK